MKNLFVKLIGLVFIAFILGTGSKLSGMSFQQSLCVSIFCASILGTLFFWDFRLSFAFLGTAVLLLTKTIDLKSVVEFSSLEVILFLMGMMVIVGLLKDEGFFAWMVQLILRIRNLSAAKFVVVISVFSALLSATTSEVVSIVFMVATVLEICDYFEVDPMPYVIICVLTTNIGSAATVLGNPVGILIASKSGLTFEDFLVKALPLAAICLVFTIGIVLVWYRKEFRKLDANIRAFGANEILIRLISVPPGRNLKFSLGIFGITLFLISLHHRTEELLGLVSNTVLLVIPLIVSACVMIWKCDKARRYIEKDVEWWSLLFFLFLFIQAGALKYTGTTVFLAKKIMGVTGANQNILLTAIIWLSSMGSSLLDNIVLVAAFIPVIQGFQPLNVSLQPLWWALLLGGCLGGNITIIGSTANIIALGILEKEKHVKITFFKWFAIGSVVGLVTTAIAWLSIMYIPLYH